MRLVGVAFFGVLAFTAAGVAHGQSTPIPDAEGGLQPQDQATGQIAPMQQFDPSGYGWCRYGDDTNKVSYFSSVFPGSPVHDTTPREQAFATFINQAYPKLTGAVTCNWSGSDTAYEVGRTEADTEFSDQVKGYKMNVTEWKPGAGLN